MYPHIMMTHNGLSPRMRGNPTQHRVYPRVCGSIPAYAGEPAAAAQLHSRHRVYPRVCGGTNIWCQAINPAWGLSPRMRGNLVCLLRELWGAGSIPAYAGEPSSPWSSRARSRVYPRVCGGTAHAEGSAETEDGLSPRMRGNLCGKPGCGSAPRSIPAYAGEPCERRYAG